MRTHMLFGAALGAAMVCLPAHAAELDAELALVSDYRWRGVSLSDEDPAAQAEATLSFDNGGWLWGQASTVSSDLGGTELSLGAGFTAEAAGVEWTAGATYYVYPGEDALDYAELALSLARTFGALTVSGGVEYTPDQNDFGDDDTYLWVGGEYAAPHDITLHGHVGRDDGVMAPAPEAIDFSVGVGKSFEALSFDLSFVDAETVDSAWVLRLGYAL